MGEVLDTDTVPDTDSDLTDMLDTVPDTVSDTAMVDTVARDPLMLTTDVDTVMEDTDTDTESKHFPLQTNQRNHSIQNYAILITAKASEHNFNKNKCQLLLTETIRKNEREF